MRTRLRSLGAGGVQARTFHSAALRQARYFWPQVYGGELPRAHRVQARPDRATPPGATGCETDQATLRDLASEIEWAKVSNVRPDDYAARRRGPRPRGQRPRRRRPSPGSSPPTRRSSATRAGWTWRTCCSARPPCSPRTSGSPPRSAGSTSGSSSTSSRTSARSSRRCSTSGSAAATTSAWSATRRRRSTPSPAPTRAYLTRLPAASYPRHHVGRAGPQLPLHAAGGRRPPTRCSPAPPAPACSCARSSEAGRRGRASREHSDEVAEAEAVAARDPRAASTPGTPAREIAVLFRINAQSEAFEEALAARGVPYVVRGAARFFERAEVRQAVTLLRGNARGGEAAPGDGLVEPTSGPCSPAWAGPTKAPTGRGNVRDRWESLQALVSPGRGASPTAAPDADAGRLRRRARPAGRRAARPGRRGRHARHPARRQGPRVGRGLPVPACRRARCRSSTPRARPRSRRSAGCSTSA